MQYRSSKDGWLSLPSDVKWPTLSASSYIEINVIFKRTEILDYWIIEYW